MKIIIIGALKNFSTAFMYTWRNYRLYDVYSCHM